MPSPVPDFGGGTQGTPLDGQLDSISCPEATVCTALGTRTYGVSTGPNPLHVFTVDEADGSWGNAHGLTIPGFSSRCRESPARPRGNCAIVGTVSKATDPQSPEYPQIYVASESGDGNWKAGTFISGIPAGDVSNPTGVSCAPGGDCTVAGYYSPSSSSGGQEFTATGVPGGTFGAARPLSFPVEYGEPVTAGPDCAHTGDCVLAASSPGTVADLPVLDSEATAATVSLRAARPSVTFGAEQAETLTATVASPATDGQARTVTRGTSPVCVIRLAHETGRCTLPRRGSPVASTGWLPPTAATSLTWPPARARP